MDDNFNLLIHWTKEYLAKLVGDSIGEIDTKTPLSYFDLDSVDAVTMAFTLEKEFQVPIHPETFLDENASIHKLCEGIFQEHFSKFEDAK